MKTCEVFGFMAIIAVLFSTSILGTRAQDAECLSDVECSTYHRCDASQCVSACTRRRNINSEPEYCGENAYCALRGKQHDGICKCLSAYRGDPYVGCTKKLG